MFELMHLDGLDAILVGIAVGGALLGWLLSRTVQRLPPRQHEDDSWRDDLPLMRYCKPLLERFAPALDKNMTKAKRAALHKKLTAAGLNYVLTPAEFVVLRIGATAIACLAVAFLLWRYQLWASTYGALLLTLIPIGYFYFELWLLDAAKARSYQIEKDFPFFLDVLVLSMRAGLAFPSALHQATIQLPPGSMRQELSRLNREVRTGSDRAAALFAMAERIKLSSISNFVAVVAQSTESGGSLTSALTEQARQRRRERFARAEKLANQAPVKLLFPLVAFLFPVTFIILGFPLVRDVSGSGLFGF